MARVMNVGTVEYLDVTVTANVTLGSQTVQISIDGGATWLSAVWSTEGFTATATVLLGQSNPLPAVGTYRVRVKVTSFPEIPIMDAGFLMVSP